MSGMASQITSLTIVYSAVYSGAEQRKHQSSASLGFARGIHRGPVNYPHKWPVTRKMIPFDDVIMENTAAASDSFFWCQQVNPHPTPPIVLGQSCAYLQSYEGPNVYTTLLDRMGKYIACVYYDLLDVTHGLQGIIYVMDNRTQGSASHD